MERRPIPRNLYLRRTFHALSCLAALALSWTDCHADQASGTGSVAVTVSDPSGAAVAHASMAISREHDSEDISRPGVPTAPGVLAVRELAPGRYRIRLEAAGFEPVTIENLRIIEGEEVRRSVRLKLLPVAETVMVGRDVQRDAIDPRGFSTFLSREQIDALPDDPESFARALQALAPPGAVIRIDGFTGGSLPPKSQILSIRIPRFDTFAAQDHGGLDGSSFIDLVTRPGGGRLAGSADVGFRSDALDARNPLSTHEGRSSARIGTLAFDGPVLPGRVSFSLSARGTSRLESTTLHAALPDGTVRAEPVSKPLDAFVVSGRLAAALGRSHTVRVSFANERQTARNLGVGGTSLPERAYRTGSTELTVRAAAGGALGRRGLFDVRTQIRRGGSRTDSDLEAPALHVLDAFSAGGAQTRGGSRSLELETAADVDYARRGHAARFGALVEHGAYDSRRAVNYFGTYTFATLEEFVENQPALYTRRIGDPAVSYSSSRVGLYAQDDWRAARSVLVSGGVRAEWQSATRDDFVVLPRTSVAWSPFHRGTTTFRAAVGIFSDWLPEWVQEQSLVVDGIRQHDVRLSRPSYPAPMGADAPAPSERYALADELRMPRALAMLAGVEQQIGTGLRVSASYNQRLGNGLLRGRNLNAPMGGVRPDPSFANVLTAHNDGSSRTRTMTVQTAASDKRRRVELMAMYVLSDSRADTTGPFAAPADSTQLDLEWGPTSPRHVATAAVTARLFRELSISLMPRWRTGTPYSVTTGRDENGDGLFTDRPSALRRNSERTPAQWELGARVSFVMRFGRPDAPAISSAGADSESLRGGSVVRDRGDGTSSQPRYRLELFASAQNVTNRVNYTGIGAVIGSPFFGQPVAASPARTIGVGIRFGF